MKKLLLAVLVLCFTNSYAELYLTPEEEAGHDLYKLNCMACHQIDQQVVGPSLVEIDHIYKKNPEGIIKWSMNPGHKRKHLIKMPPMAHVGEKNLAKIVSYIKAATKGKKFNPKKKKSRKDPFEKFPVAKIQRMFMPDAGPAAIAVSLNDNLHLCWDAGTCQFRYAWTGGYIELWPVVRGNGNGLVNLKGEKFTYVKQGKPLGDNTKIKFEGYKRKDGLPIFMYTVDNVKFEVSFKANSSKAVDVIFNTNSSNQLTYSPALTQGKWSANKGVVKDGSLILTPKESKNFTITFSAGDK